MEKLVAILAQLQQHTEHISGIGTLPILFYGSNEIKEKFLPKICSGEWMSCYNLTEPNAGSDANSGKTTATLTNDGNSYEITGQKIWISNAGFAEVFILFGRIENDKNITGFVLEKSKSNGINLGEEENKLGLRASSTRQVFYEKLWSKRTDARKKEKVLKLL